MKVSRCKWDTVDEVTRQPVCVNPKSDYFSMVKDNFCSSIKNGCKYWECIDPLDLILCDETLPWYPESMIAKI